MRSSKLIIAIVASYVLIAVGFLVVHKYISGVNARDDLLMQCMIYHGYLERLDKDDITADEKVSKLSESMAGRMAILLVVLETADCFSISDLLRFDMGLSDDEFNKTKNRMKDYLVKRRELESGDSYRKTSPEHQPSPTEVPAPQSNWDTRINGFCYYDAVAVADLPREARCVDPECGPYSVPWGSPPQALVARLGRPNGLIYVDPETFLLKYGNCDLFVFKNRVLTAYKLINFSSRDFYLFLPEPGPDPNPRPFFRSPYVVDLGDGVRLDMTFEEVENHLGRKLTEEKNGWRYYLDRPKSRTTFWFGARSRTRERVLTMVYIEARAPGTPPASSQDDWNAQFLKMTATVKRGMTKAEVTEAVGKPNLRQQIQYEDIREVWKYNLEPDIRFQVNFDADGKVVGQQLDAPKLIRN